MEAKTTLVTVAGVNTNVRAAESNMLEMRRLQVVGTYNQPLSYRSPDEIEL